MKINDRCTKTHITAERSSATSLSLITSNVSVCVCVCAARRAHHIKDELVDVEVGILLHAADDAALDHAAAALHLQARGGNARQLEALQVTDAPRYDLRDRTGRQVSLLSSCNE